MNNITVSGYVGKDLEKRVFSSGGGVSLFSLAVKRLYSNKDGEYDTQWIDCRILGLDNGFSRYAEKVCKRGSYIIVSGEMFMNKYREKNGEYRQSPYIIVNRLEVVNTHKETSNVSSFGDEQSIEDDLF